MGRGLLNFFLAFSLLTISFVNSYGQYKELFVKKIAQMDNTWCWAASIEMVMEFHQPSTPNLPVQPDIVLKYANFNKTWKSKAICRVCSSSVVYSIPYANSMNTCYFPIPFSRNGIVSVDFLDQIFNSYGYHSSQRANPKYSPMLWNRLKIEIDNCRPFIVFIEPLAHATISSDHAMVVKGYWMKNVNGVDINYFIANDPWASCSTGSETIFPFTNFTDQPGSGGGSLNGSSIQVNRVLATVTDIRQDLDHTQLDDYCSSCRIITAARSVNGVANPCFTTVIPANLSGRTTGIGGEGFSVLHDTIKDDPKDERLISILAKNAVDVVGFEENKIDDSKMNTYLKKIKYFGAMVKYLSVEKLDKCFIFHGPNKIDKTLSHEEEVMDVVSGEVDVNIVSTFQKKDGIWVLNAISNFTLLKDKVDINFDTSSSNNKKFILSNLQGPDSIQGSLKYELIKFPPFKYEFLSFEYNGQAYMSPAADYSDLKLYKGIAYREKKVIGGLRVLANDYLNQYRQAFKLQIKTLAFNPKDKFQQYGSTQK